MAPSDNATAHGDRLDPVWARRWHWYRSRLGAGVVVTALGCVVFVSAVVTTGTEWHEQLSPPLEPVNLVRSSAAQVSRDLPVVVLGEDPPTGWGQNARFFDKAHESVVTDHTGTPLVDERLVSFRRERLAESHVLELIASNAGSARRDPDRFSIQVGCPDACRHAKVARKGNVVILLAGREAGAASEAERIEAALVKVANRYAETLPAGHRAGR
jgi:hypothetical protein